MHLHVMEKQQNCHLHPMENRPFPSFYAQTSPPAVTFRGRGRHLGAAFDRLGFRASGIPST